MLRGTSRGRKARDLFFPDAVLGLRLAEWAPKQEAVPDAVTALAEARLAARRTKNWVDADRLRTELHAAGWEMEDRADGYALKRK
jgi:cysteinyl-tRNA synthetase